MLKRLLLLALVAGCGLPDDRTIGDLDDGAREKLCKELADFDPVTLESDGVPLVYEPEVIADCVLRLDVPESCIATVGDQRDCAEGFAAATCDFDPTVGACAALFDESCLPLGL